LEKVQSGKLDIDAALNELRNLPYENLDGFATLDHHRALRNGFPEVVFGQGKRPEQVVAIARRLAERSDKVLVTRVDPAMAEAVRADFPDLVYHSLPDYWFDRATQSSIRASSGYRRDRRSAGR
jgi:NCAIR mutase (PurE)-related protein